MLDTIDFCKYLTVNYGSSKKTKFLDETTIDFMAINLQAQ